MQQSERRVDHLDGIRALAIAGVIATHWVDGYLPIGTGGLIGVDLFFVLSGFIITTILWRQSGSGWVSGVGTFLWRRVCRLYPALAGLVLGCVAVAFFVPFVDYGPGDVLRQGAEALAQIAWWDMAHGRFVNVFPHTWSLAAEWVFYLVWPWLVLGARRRGLPAGRAAFITAGMALLAFVGAFSLDPYVFTYSPAGRVSAILAGGWLALWLAAGRGRSAPHAQSRLGWCALLALAAYLAYVLVGPRSLEPGARFVGFPLAVACGLFLTWYGYVGGRGVAMRILTAVPMTFLGRISYSLYLWHLPPLIVLDKDTTDLPVLALAAIGVAFAVVATAVSYALLERPFAGSRGAVLASVRAPEAVPVDLSGRAGSSG